MYELQPWMITVTEYKIREAVDAMIILAISDLVAVVVESSLGLSYHGYQVSPQKLENEHNVFILAPEIFMQEDNVR